MTRFKAGPFGHWAFVSFVVLYGALLASHLNHGLASLDAHGIVQATQNLIENQRIAVSRPPGHPTTEVYLFGAVAWLLKNGFGYKFDDKAYLVLQALAGLATLVVFYELLLQLDAKGWRAFFATVCLAFSAQYFSNVVDGEEFVFALFFILVALRLLIVEPESPVNFGRLLLSIFSFALATGCRPEVVFAGVIYPIYCQLHPKLGLKYALGSLVIQAVAVFLVWLPIFFAGIRAPYSARMNWRESILGGGYKLIFQGFTLLVFVLLCWVLLTALMQWRTGIRRPFPRNFVFVISVLLPLIFFALFFRYATKPAYLLVTLPFLLLLAIERSSALLLGLAAVTLIGCFVSVDIFQGRQLVRPFLVPGTSLQAIRQKPFYKLSYLHELMRQCDAEPTVIVAEAWPWDFDYHVARGSFPARQQVVGKTDDRDLTAFFPQEGETCIILSRDAVFRADLLKDWQTKGYRLKMDATLYRASYARYEVGAPLNNSTSVGDLSFKLFSARSPSP